MFSEVRWRLISAITAGVMLIAVHAFEWSIVDRITPFLYLPLAGVVWWVVIGVGLASLTCLTKIRAIGIRSFVPTAVVALSVLIVVLVPFTDLWLKLDYSLYRKERNEIVQKILGGDLTSNVSYNAKLIALGDTYPLVSMGGNEVVVEEHNGNMYILFYTFRGKRCPRPIGLVVDGGHDRMVGRPVASLVATKFAMFVECDGRGLASQACSGRGLGGLREVPGR
ncbi:MAG: hypothetical protein GEU89_20685 [Kiloniellaceae bacterium]|nr:hypothetical protein [Kiloniellaceae bacterium]